MSCWRWFRREVDRLASTNNSRSIIWSSYMSLSRALSRIDRFLAAILLTVALASVVPARGEAAVVAAWLTNAGIMVLFFMHGARLSPEAAWAGARHWRLHAVIFLSTFVLFPLLVVSCH